jgi:hypothetical protein
MQMINHSKLFLFRIMHSAQACEEVIIQFAVVVKELKNWDYQFTANSKTKHISEKLLFHNSFIKLY